MKCEEKVQYNNKRQAWKNAYYFYKVLGDKTGVYTCNICGKFHLSKKIKMDVPLDILNDKNFIKKVEKKLYIKKASVLERKLNDFKLKVKKVISKLYKFLKVNKQKFKELWQQLVSIIRKGHRKFKLKRQFKDETLSHEEMKKALAQLKK